MVRVPLWKVILIIAICVLSFAYAAPNVMSEKQLEWARANLPSWMPNKTVYLGLDLRGGSHLMLEVGLDTVLKDRLESLSRSVKVELRKDKLRVASTRVWQDNSVLVELSSAEGASEDAVRAAIRRAEPNIQIDRTGKGAALSLTYSATDLKQMRDHAIEQSIEIVRRRVDETGTREPVINRQGDNRIVVQLPGIDNPDHVKQLIGKTAKLGFHLVDQEGSMRGSAGVGEMLLPSQENPAEKLVVERQAIITGDMLETAQPSFNQMAGRPVVTFRLNSSGTRNFCDVTTRNTGAPFAIVLDNVVISAPRINEPICGGSAEISGTFTVQQASDLALLLRAGALPAPLDVVEERSVGPSLGADSVAAGRTASIAALGFVIAFMCICYGLFGMFAALALCINMVMIFAVMSLMQATLTLPGIAGIILTIGMAVDANVLIFERIREEAAAGRSVIASLDAGYNKAFGTIMDSNVTTLIAAILLFAVGTGPVKGFAVTLSIGVVTSMFSAVMVTRLMVLRWLKSPGGKSLPL